MSIFQKEPLIRPANGIYRGNEERLGGHPIPKTVDYFDKMGTFENRLQWAAKKGLLLGSFAAVFDYIYASRLTERKAVIMRGLYFTAPVFAGVTGFVAGLEICKRVFDDRRLAYGVAAMVPCAILSTWRRQTPVFFKSLGILVPPAVIYAECVEENLHMGWKSANPNNPADFYNRDMSYFGMKQPSFITLDSFRGGRIHPKDPGPYYAKFEKDEQ